jgi:hypothetical protein
MLPAVSIVLERLCEDFAGLLELRTFLELPNNLAGFAGSSLDYSLQLSKHSVLSVKLRDWV